MRKEPGMEKKQLSSKVAASMRYNETHCKQIKLSLNVKTDADIIEYLDKCENVQGLIKRLIREQIE